MGPAEAELARMHLIRLRERRAAKIEGFHYQNSIGRRAPQCGSPEEGIKRDALRQLYRPPA